MRRRPRRREPRLAHILKILRRAAFERQGGLCYWCGLPMVVKTRANGPQVWDDPRVCTADHLKLRSQGGRTTRQNIVAACRECNNRRHQSAPPLDLPSERIA